MVELEFEASHMCGDVRLLVSIRNRGGHITGGVESTLTGLLKLPHQCARCGLVPIFNFPKGSYCLTVIAQRANTSYREAGECSGKEEWGFTFT